MFVLKAGHPRRTKNIPSYIVGGERGCIEGLFFQISYIEKLLFSD